MNKYFNGALPLGSNLNDGLTAKDNKQTEITQHAEKPVNCSVLNALEAQGRAQINLAFKGGVIARKPQTMSDSEFEQFKNEFYEKVKKLPYDTKEEIENWEVTKTNIKLINKLLSDEKFYRNEALIYFSGYYINYMDEEEAGVKLDFLNLIKENGLINNAGFMKYAGSLLNSVETKDKFNLLKEIISNKELIENPVFMNKAGSFINAAETENQLKIANKILSDNRLISNTDFMEYAGNIILNSRTNESAERKGKILDEVLLNNTLMSNETFMEYFGKLLNYTKNQYQADFFNKITENKELYENENFMKQSVTTMEMIYKEDIAAKKINFINKLLADKNLLKNETFMKYAGNITGSIDNSYNEKLVDKIMKTPELYNNEDFLKKAKYLIAVCNNEKQAELANEIISDEKFYNNKIFMDYVYKLMKSLDNDDKIKMLKKIMTDENLCRNNDFLSSVALFFAQVKTQEQIELLNKVFSLEKIPDNSSFLRGVGYCIVNVDDSFKKDTINRFLEDKELLENEVFLDNIQTIIENSKTNEEIETNIKILKDKQLTYTQKELILAKDIDYSEIQKLNAVIGLDNAAKLPAYETRLASKFVDLYKKQNINEIPIKIKRDLLKNLTAAKEGYFRISDEMQEMFPLLPSKLEDYCLLFPSIVNSLGIETDTLNNSEITDFYNNIFNLADSLSDISDDEFKNIKISQNFSKDDFINNILDNIKELSPSERQKVFDCFGFELHRNKNASFKSSDGTGYSITGYPSTINNNAKLAQIKNPHTKIVINNINNIVSDFLNNNPVFCTDKNLEKNLNTLIKFLPELRPAIGKIQAGMYGTEGSHQFDILQHSLKVMQGIVQNPQFNNLNDSDKKILLLASLLHDITKTEGFTDRHHPDNSSFDAFFITKKFKLSKEEEIKLYNLIKHHEWLGFVNRSSDLSEQTSLQQSVAYDLRHDNLFELSLIFTHADLKGVNDEFHDVLNEKRISKADGITRSYGNAADFHAENIRKYINELKKSQPLLPVTKLPKADMIEKAIKIVNQDGSTNIKGVYKDKDGLIVLKFNELENEDLEKIGFPKGSTVKGISSFTNLGDMVDTGNVKFFAHGLDFPNQLVKFDAFSLVDSQVLLSASYAERPESKSRFFRPQGVLLDCDTKYVHGGGNTDSGSGCGKFIEEFKQNYIFGGKREPDRNFISDLIKNTLKLNDEEYLQFVKKNENKSFNEIVPEEDRIKLIKAFAKIHSNKRDGNREYNEMYISNPKPPMAVFAYNEDFEETIHNPVEFLNRTVSYNPNFMPVKDRTGFLREFALKNNLPFFIFGD